jgi:hypothetical protein
MKYHQLIKEKIEGISSIAKIKGTNLVKMKETVEVEREMMLCTTHRIPSILFIAY